MQTTNTKEPWLAVWLSSIFPGIGQLYSKNRFKGLTFVLVTLILISALIACILAFVIAPSKMILATGALLVSLIFSFSFYNYFDAFHTAKAHNITYGLWLPSRKKDPFLSLFLSGFIPGLGQVYNSQWLKGIGVLISVIVIGHILRAFKPAGHLFEEIFNMAARLWIMNDAYSSASKINGEPSSLIERFGGRKVLGISVLWFFMPFLLAATLFTCAYSIEAYKFPSTSMSPTLMPGDQLFVNTRSYRNSEPLRGDLVVVQDPGDPKKTWLKRVIGLPNEKLKIKDGHIFVNGKLLNTPSIPSTRYYYNREDWQYGKPGQNIEIPSDSYFVMGDNSAQSSDSRNWGFVPRKNIKAKAIYIYWPWNRQRQL